MSFRDVRSARKFMGQLLEHQPGTIDVREFRVDLLNTAYMAVNDMADWLFLQNEEDWNVWQERVGVDLGVTVTANNGLYLIQFSASLGASFSRAAGGMTFEDENGTNYTINRFVSPTQAYLDRGYEGATVVGMTTWKIKSGRYYLPVNCSRALAFINRDTDQYRGPMSIVDRRTEENSAAWFGDNQGTVFWLVDNTAEYDDPPQPGYVATESTAAGSLASDSDYEVCYTTTQFGRESPPSVTARVKMSTAANHQIVLTGLVDTRNGLLDTGVYKNVYIRRLTSSQVLPDGDVYTRWYLAAENVAEGTVTVTISAFPANSAATLTYQNGRKYMKTVWNPGGDYTFRLRYLRKPPRLVADSDAPYAWPEAYHDLIVYGAAINLGLSQGAAASKTDRWQKLYDNLLTTMRAQQLMVPNMSTVKRMRGDGYGGSQLYYTRGNATTDYSGS